MDEEASPAPEPGPVPAGEGAGATTDQVPARASFHADRHGLAPKQEWRLRRAAGGKGMYRGPIVACTRGWVSRDSRWHVFAARFLDFALLTPEHLVLCSTGFFTRRPRRQVLREPLTRLFVTTIGPPPSRTLRIVGDFSNPIRIELRDQPDTAAFMRELIARTPTEVARRRGDAWAVDEMNALPKSSAPALEAAPPEVEAE
jgi:hypothetical protein